LTTKADEIPQIEITATDAVMLLDRVKAALATEDYQILEKIVSSFFLMERLLEKQGITIKEFRKLFIIGMKSEKLATILEELERKESASTAADSEVKTGEPVGGIAPTDETETTKEGASEKKRKGHGRKPADAYVGAEKVDIPHETLKPGDPCPEAGCKGTLYAILHPKVLVRFRGQAPLGATVFRLGQLRCNLCLTVFTAEAPPEAGTEKYDATAGSMITLLRYGIGVPWNRVEGLQAGFGIPLPASTQWDVTEAAYKKIVPALEELKNQAAQGDVFYNDDTTVRILSLIKENKERRKEKQGHG
jgi:transposase